MSNNRFSAVQLTLLSVIVALILENLLNQFSNQSVGWSSPLPLLQAAVIAITVISLWSGFALILSTSERKPSLVDFVYPFGLLIMLTLAANSMGGAQLTKFFTFLGLGALFACWALRAEYVDLPIDSLQALGIRRGFYTQVVSTGLCLIMALVLAAANPPEALVIFALCILVVVQVFAALGTMWGWRGASEPAGSS